MRWLNDSLMKRPLQSVRVTISSGNPNFVLVTNANFLLVTNPNFVLVTKPRCSDESLFSMKGHVQQKALWLVAAILPPQNDHVLAMLLHSTLYTSIKRWNPPLADRLCTWITQISVYYVYWQCWSMAMRLGPKNIQTSGVGNPNLGWVKVMCAEFMGTIGLKINFWHLAFVKFFYHLIVLQRTHSTK